MYLSTINFYTFWYGLGKNYQPAQNKHKLRLPDFFAEIKLKIGLSASKKVVFICFNESPLKMMVNAYFMLKSLFGLEIFMS